nr:VRR-NUC domain-containing protein [Deinobacterium chartae]
MTSTTPSIAVSRNHSEPPRIEEHWDEHQHQVKLISWCDQNTDLYPDLALIFAIPSGENRHVLNAIRLKAQGVRPGVPDLCLPVPSGPYHGLYIELKALGGRASKDQSAWIRRLSAAGYRAAVCKGWRAARDVILEYLAASQEQEQPGETEQV